MILNSRPREQATELSRLLVAAGFEVLEAPAIETIPAWEASELQAVRAALGTGAYDWVVLPSQNAGRDLVGALGHTRVVCGTATAEVLGLVPTRNLERFSARAALEALKALVAPGQRVLVPRAEESRDELFDGLAALGVEVHAPIAYRTVAVEPSLLAAQLQARAITAVTVCSPSALHALLAAGDPSWLSITKLICLGETTAQAARQAGLRVDGVAERTSMASLVRAVQSVVEAPRVVA